MPKPLPVLRELLFRAALLLSCASGFNIMAQETNSADLPQTRFYLSNISGMMLESVPSRMAAMRSEFCLGVSLIPRNEIPAVLISFYDSLYTIELRVLYENGEASRRQWIFRDQNGIARLNASGTYGEERNAEITFIEIFNEDHSLAEERQFNDGGETITRYAYSNDFLIKSEIWLGPQSEANKPDITDRYWYTRSASLRAIERTFHSGTEAADQKRIPFPGLAPRIVVEPEFTSPGLAYSPVLPDSGIPPDTRMLYDTDARGRILSERQLDENGEPVNETLNTWSGDRLVSIRQVSGDNELLTEYEYDDQGNRVLERNYNRGVLERVVRSSGNREIEELYMDGKIMLRAVWEDGRKISEERIRGQR